MVNSVARNPVRTAPRSPMDSALGKELRPQILSTIVIHGGRFKIERYIYIFGKYQSRNKYTSLVVVPKYHFKIESFTIFSNTDIIPFLKNIMNLLIIYCLNFSIIYRSIRSVFPFVVCSRKDV